MPFNQEVIPLEWLDSFPAVTISYSAALFIFFTGLNLQRKRVGLLAYAFLALGGVYSFVVTIDGIFPPMVGAHLWAGLVALTLATCVITLTTPHYTFYVLAAISALLPMVLVWLVLYAHAIANGEDTVVLAPNYAMAIVVLMAAVGLSTIGAIIETRRVFFSRRVVAK